METHIPNREEAYALLKEYNQSQALIQHALAVEASMRYLARKWAEDEEQWGLIGLIHDLDYEKFPDEHCRKTKTFWRKRAGRMTLSGPSSLMAGDCVPMSNPEPAWKKPFMPSMN